MSQQWWHRAVVYQIYPRSFRDTTGNGVGDLDGITEKLPYLQQLGVDAVWISPFFPSPMADYGYDVADYTDVDPLFGTLDDFDRLVRRAHDLDLKIIIDWVPNHSSDRHPWFLESKSSRDNPKRDWYVWSDPKPDGSPPNNWVALFGGSAWEWDEATEQYYLHTFLKEQPELNWRDTELKAAMLDTLRFWLDRGVDGLRMDVVNFIMKDPHLRDNPRKETARTGDSPWFHAAYEEWVHVNDKKHPDVHGVLREIRAVLDSYPNPERIAIGEIEPEPWDMWVEHYGDNDELHLPFNFALIDAEWTAPAVAAVVEGLESALPDGAWPNYVLGNHDQTRVASRVGRAQARVAAMLLLTLRGTPTLYYGDELGMAQTDIAPEDQLDPYGRRVPGQGRDGCRTPMQWSAERGAGFSSHPDVEPWLPVHPDFELVNVDAESADPTSMLALYRSLLRLRRSSEALMIGDYLMLDAPPNVYRYRRTAGSETIEVVLNFSHDPVTVEAGGSVALSTRVDRDGTFDGSIAGDEGVIVTR